LTGSSDAADWWDGLIGEGRLLDPAKYFFICANMLGSCYGATNPKSINPQTGEIYGRSFPTITIRDMVHAHQILQEYLGIEHIRLIIGGSMGGQQALEWSIIAPNLFDQAVLLACNARHSAWGIAFNESQRMALEADHTLYSNAANAGQKGLEAARAIAMISYRHYDIYQKKQTNKDGKLEDFKASSYQRYQGHKLWQRFDPLSYIILSKAMDNHHVGRGRNGIKNALQQVNTPTLVVGIQSDILFPIEEQRLIAHHLPNAQFEAIDSLYGHDGFLVEYEKLSSILKYFIKKGVQKNSIPLFSPFQRPDIPGTESF